MTRRALGWDNDRTTQAHAPWAVNGVGEIDERALHRRKPRIAAQDSPAGCRSGKRGVLPCTSRVEAGLGTFARKEDDVEVDDLHLRSCCFVAWRSSLMRKAVSSAWSRFTPGGSRSTSTFPVGRRLSRGFGFLGMPEAGSCLAVLAREAFRCLTRRFNVGATAQVPDAGRRQREEERREGASERSGTRAATFRRLARRGPRRRSGPTGAKPGLGCF